MHDATSTPAHALFDADEIRDALETGFYAPSPAAKRSRRTTPKPEHYEVICISLYNEDLAALDAKVDALKARGHRKMSRSALIRYALEKLDLEQVPAPSRL